MTTRATRTTYCPLLQRLFPILLGVLAVGALLLGADPASAANCIQDVWKAHGNSQNLTCTANDVRLSNVVVTGVSEGGSCDSSTPPKCTCNAAATPPTTCAQPGDVGYPTPGCVTFTGTFDMLLGAQTRYDIGLYIATDGGGADGALTGTCAINILTPYDGTIPVTTPPDGLGSTNFIQYDASPDICGDIDATHNPQHMFWELTVACIAGDDGKLKLPNCTSWRTSGQNDVCDEATDAYPGSPSKCNCQPGFTVDIFVETASVKVTKSAAPTSVPEAGATVTYTVLIENKSSQATYTIDSIIDDVYGNLGTDTPPQTNNTCPSLIGTTIAAGGSTSCTFDAFVQGDSGGSVTDTAEVCGHDNFGHTGLCGHDDATVDITDSFTAPTLTKTAQSAANCQLDVTYQVVVSNNSGIDTLTVNSLTDDKFGVITTTHAANTSCTGSATPGVCEQVVTACTLSQNPIPPSGNANCTFVGRIVSSSCAIDHTDTVTGNVTDDDGVTSTPSNDATVHVEVTFP